MLERPEVLKEVVSRNGTRDTTLRQTALAELDDLPKDTPLVFQCHHGGRSQRAAEMFVARGFVEVYNLIGGIDAWSDRIDPSIPKY